MSEIAEFTRHLGNYLPPPDIALVERAFQFSDSAHRGQFRKSGEPYITHPLAVASILSQWRLDAQGLAAALLHDVMEDTAITKSEIETSFGKLVADMVDGLSKLDQIEFNSREDAQAESFRKMLLAMAQDVRVILIKLADRLHNMRTLDAMAPPHRRRIAHETLDIYAPIANRLGLNSLYVELQDLAFKHLYPMRFRILANAIKAARGNRREVMNRLLDVIRDGLAKAGITRRRVGAREDDLFRLQEDGREALHVLAGVRHLRRARAGPRPDRLLRGAGRAARPLQADPGEIQGLHRDPEGQRLPVAAHDAVRPVRHAARGPDPHARHAPHRRDGRRRALAVQVGGRARPRAGAARHASLAAEPARDPVGIGRLEGVSRERQGRPLSRRDLRVHAEGQDHGAAARRDRGRFRVRGAHRRRPPLRRGAHQLRAHAAAHRAQERRPRRGPHLADGPAQSVVAVVRRHRQGALADPAFPQGPAAEGVGGARRAAARPGARHAQGRAGVRSRGSAGSRCRRNSAPRASSTSSPTSGSASGCPSSWRRR